MTARSIKVPSDMDPHYVGLTALTDTFCLQHLDENYRDLARCAIAALCRKRPSPVRSGQPRTWACGVVYALGQLNFLSDRSHQPYMAMADVCAGFGVSPSTAAAKAQYVRKALKMQQFGEDWSLLGIAAQHPLEHFAPVPRAFFLHSSGRLD